MRLAHRAPQKCAGCYAQRLDMPHVDFESAHDGPLIDPDRPRSGHIDWLILCAECVQTAYRLLPEQRDETAALRAEIDRLRDQLKDEQNYAQRLEDAFGSRPASRPKKTAPRKRAA